MYLCRLGIPYRAFYVKRITDIAYCLSQLFEIGYSEAQVLAEEVEYEKVEDKFDKIIYLYAADPKVHRRIYSREKARERSKFTQECVKMVRRLGYGYLMGLAEVKELITPR